MSIEDRVLTLINKFYLLAVIKPAYIYVGDNEYNEMVESDSRCFHTHPADNGKEYFMGKELVRVMQKDHLNVGLM